MCPTPSPEPAASDDALRRVGDRRLSEPPIRPPKGTKAAFPNPSPVIPQGVLAGFNARILNPDTAYLAPGQPVPQPTVYAANTLLVRGLPGVGGAAQPVIDDIAGVAKELGYSVEVSPIDLARAERARVVAEQIGEDWISILNRSAVTQIGFERSSGGVQRVADAWVILQELIVTKNHNGSLDRALSMIDAAADTGADAIKIQTYTADTITMDVDRPEFKIHGGLWDGRSLHELYQEAQTSYE